MFYLAKTWSLNLMSEGNPKVSIVLPVRNQADHIRSVVENHIIVLESKIVPRLEIVLVENGSTDASVAVCEDLAREYQGRVQVISLVSPRTGWGAAVQYGLSKARGELLCYSSSARVASEVLASFVERGLQNPDKVVQAVRSGHDNFLRSIASWVYNLECRLLFGLSTRDVNGNPKVFPRKFQRLLELKEEGFMIDLEFNIVCKEAGYEVLSVPVAHTKRHGGKSMTSLSLGGSLYVEALRMFRESRLGAASVRGSINES